MGFGARMLLISPSLARNGLLMVRRMRLLRFGSESTFINELNGPRCYIRFPPVGNPRSDCQILGLVEDREGVFINKKDNIDSL